MFWKVWFVLKCLCLLTLPGSWTSTSTCKKRTFIQKVRIILFLELWKPTKKKEKPMLRLQFKYELLTPSSLRERSKTRFLVFVFFKKCILLVQQYQKHQKYEIRYIFKTTWIWWTHGPIIKTEHPYYRWIFQGLDQILLVWEIQLFFGIWVQ